MASGSGDPSRTFHQLDGSNYGIWKLRMQLFLEEKDLWEVVKPEKQEATTAVRETSSYIKKERRAYVVIAQMVADTQLPYIQDLKTGAEAWKALEDVYVPKGRAHTKSAKRKFEKLKKLPTEEMKTWFSRVEAAALEVRNSGATCDSEDIFLKILDGLP